MDEPPLLNSAASSPSNHGFTYAVYILYLIAIPTAVPMFLGVIFAYVMRDRREAWLDTHHRYQIRTFWIMWVYLLVALLFIPLWFVGVPMFALVAVWIAVRCVIGLAALHRGLPVERPGSWLF